MSTFNLCQQHFSSMSDIQNILNITGLKFTSLGKPQMQPHAVTVYARRLHARAIYLKS